jgi:hypothetical protein
MAETGGPTTQAGIFFQNTIAALYLGRMLDLRPRTVRDRVLSVRLEAPEAVDDIVIGMGDGAIRFIQAKLALSQGSDAWIALWQSFANQFLSFDLQIEARLVLVIGEASNLATDLRECCMRMTSNSSHEEYLNRLTKNQKKIINSIESALLPDGRDLAFILNILAKTDIETIQGCTIERDFTPLWLPESSVAPNILLGILRDIAGGGARFRAKFEPASLRERLRTEHAIDLPEPSDWGSSHYRQIITEKALINIPGTNFSKRIDHDFPWPSATRYDRTRKADFDDETPRFDFDGQSDQVDIALFPTDGFARLVVVAGPGFGKSILTKALAAQTAKHGRLPVIISIPELSKLDIGIAKYLSDHINTEYEVNIDWTRASEAGLLVLLLDGLDEVASDRRVVILERIKTFTARHQSTPWLLTVRDAAALAAPTDALLIELEPLNSAAINQHIKFYRPTDGALPEILQQQFRLRPDVLRLARIPLFLAILLSTLKDPKELPANRTALLEAYLDLLFQPEQFKVGEGDAVDPVIARSIAEASAFQALERDEIGLNARKLEENASRLAPTTPAKHNIERLVKCGVLQKTSGARYVFPFPIVQEYLAACHIISNRQEEIAGRLNSVVKRPWAQAIQFTLEQHPSPTELVKQLLADEDDAFNTNLRLVARCVSNGMKLGSGAWQEIAKRLAACWANAPWSMSDRVGNLIAESFSKPLIPEVRALLGNRWLLRAGAGVIVAQANDNTLTKAVLNNLLAGDIEHLFHLGELQEAVNHLGDEALTIYIARLTDLAQDVDAICCLLAHLDPKYLSISALLAIGTDTSLPFDVRITAFTLMPPPLDVRALPLIDDALIQNTYESLAGFVKLTLRSENPLVGLRTGLIREDITIETRFKLLDQISCSLPEGQIVATIGTLADDDGIDYRLRQRLQVLSARHGNLNAMQALTVQICELPVDIVGATISIFGYHRSRDLVQVVVAQLMQRTLAASDRIRLAASIVTGMTSFFEMTAFNSGCLLPAPTHPGLDLFRALYEQWRLETDYTQLEALSLDNGLVALGSVTALERLTAKIKQVLDANDMDLQDYNNSSDVDNAIYTLRARQHVLSLPFLETIIKNCSHNSSISAIQMIAALGTQDAFDSLLAIYSTTGEYHLKDVALSALETLASRLGLRVKKIDGRLEATSI